MQIFEGSKHLLLETRSKLSFWQQYSNKHFWFYFLVCCFFEVFLVVAVLVFVLLWVFLENFVFLILFYFSIFFICLICFNVIIFQNLESKKNWNYIYYTFNKIKSYSFIITKSVHHKNLFTVVWIIEKEHVQFYDK